MLLVALGLLVPVALGAWAAAGRWLRPGAMFAGYWTVAAVAPLLWWPTTRLGPRAIIYLAAAAFLFSLGALIAGGLGRREVDPGARTTVTLNRTTVLCATWVGGAAGFAAGLLALREHGLSAVSLLSVNGILESGNTIAADRYTGDGSSPLIAGLLGLAYAGSLIAPYARVLDPMIKRRWLSAPIASAVFFAAVTTAKSALLVAGVCTLGGFIAARVLRTGDAPRVTRRGMALTALAACLFAVVSVALMFVRLGNVDSPDVNAVQEKMGVYAFGYAPGFSQWLDRREAPTAPSEPLHWGRVTVSTPVYEDFTVISASGLSTNVYTIFRGLIMDFGTGGAALVVFGLGLLAGFTFRRAAVTGSLGAAIILGCVYVVVLFSNITSIVSFTNVCGAMVVATAVLYWASRPALHRDYPLPAGYSSRISS